jgi:hypothetical protein
MRILAPLLLAASSACGGPGHAGPALPIPDDEVLAGVFEGRVPCDAPCEKLKVRVILRHDAARQSPSTASIEWIAVPRPEHDDDAVRRVWQGRWETAIGTRRDPDAVVYRLRGAPDGFAAYQVIGSKVLVMLDGDLEPRVGTAAWSFTLSRTR